MSADVAAGSKHRLHRLLVPVDSRTLAWFRIALGTLIAVDALTWWTLASAIPLESGIFSRANRGFTPFLAYELAVSEVATKCLLGAQIVVGLFIAAGWGARAFAVVAFYLLGSLHERALTAVDHGDVLLRTLTLWAAFVPLSRRGSPRRLVRSVGTTALFVQLPVVYLFTVLLKLRFAPVWVDGSAVQHALAVDAWVTSWGGKLARADWLHAPLTYAVLAVELAIPLLVLSPLRRRSTRLAAFSLAVLLHLGLALFLELALFPWICVVAALPFLAGRPRSLEQEPRLTWTDRACAALFVLVVSSNFASLLEGWGPRRVQSTLAVIHLRQSWDMYVGDPAEVADGWFALRAKKQDGTVIDLLRDGATFSPQKPRVVARAYPSLRWGLILNGLANGNASADRVAAVLVDQWNRQRPAELVSSAELVFIHDLSRSERVLGRSP